MQETTNRLRVELRERDIIIASLLARIAFLEERIAVLEKNTRNSPKPPSSDIVKPPKALKSKGRCHVSYRTLKDDFRDFFLASPVFLSA